VANDGGLNQLMGVRIASLSRRHQMVLGILRSYGMQRSIICDVREGRIPLHAASGATASTAL